MKQLFSLIVALVLLAFAFPAFAVACSDCATDPIMAAADTQADTADLATAIYQKVDAQTRDVEDVYFLAVNSVIGDEEGTDFRGGDLLRQCGKQMS